MPNPQMLSHIQGCAVGVTLEALGVHHETLTAQEIHTLTDGEGLTGLTPQLKSLAFASVGNIPLGGTSDDWQLWSAVARSLLHRGGQLDPVDMAREHVLELARCTDGWGSSTKDGVLLAKRVFDFGGVEAPRGNPVVIRGRKPVPVIDGNPNGKGCGNGVAMKIGPLAIASFMEKRNADWLWNACRELGELTHPDPRAWIAAYALAWCIRDRLCLVDERATALIVPTPVDMLERLITDLDWREPPSNDRVADHLRGFLFPQTFASAEALRETTGTSCYALESVPFVIGSFLRHPLDIRAGVLEVLNAGGDTDTNVGMYASLAGANVGIAAMPQDWLAQIPSSRQALALGTALAHMVEDEGFAFYLPRIT